MHVCKHDIIGGNPFRMTTRGLGELWKMFKVKFANYNHSKMSLGMEYCIQTVLNQEKKECG